MPDSNYKLIVSRDKLSKVIVFLSAAIDWNELDKRYYPIEEIQKIQQDEFNTGELLPPITWRRDEFDFITLENQPYPTEYRPGISKLLDAETPGEYIWEW